jgi:hypothetical protein
MALDALLARLEGRAVTPVTADAGDDVTPKPAPIKACTPVTSVTAENYDTAGKATDARRQRVLAILAERPGIHYALITDDRADPEAVILSLAIRGAMQDGSTVTYELRIPRAKYDPFLLLDLIERHGATVH